MGNTETSTQKYEKIDFLQPQQAIPQSHPQRALDETVYQRYPQQRSSHSPKPQQQPMQAMQKQIPVPAPQQHIPQPQVIHPQAIQYQPQPQVTHQQYAPQLPVQQPIPQPQPIQQLPPQIPQQQVPMVHQHIPQVLPKPVVPQLQEWRINLQHPHLLRTLGGQPEGDQMRYYFEYCPISLQGLLSDRIGTKKHFPEDDLQAMLLGISSAISFLQEQGLSHGDISEAEIYFDQASSSFKILDSALINGRAAGIVATLQGRPGLWLSPELYQAIHTNQPQVLFQQLQLLPEEILCKNDVWCLGMVMLQSCLLQSVEDLYIPGGHFKYDLLQQKLGEISQIYSQELTYAIQVMLQRIEQRPDPVTLFAHLASLFAQQQQQPQIPTQIPQLSYYQPQQQVIQQQPVPQSIPSHIPQQPQQLPQPPQMITPQQMIQPQQMMPQSLPQSQQDLYYDRYAPSPNRLQSQQPQSQPYVPVKQVIKQIVYPDGHVEYQYSQPEDQTVQRPQTQTKSPSRINYAPYGQQQQQQQPVPMHQIVQQQDPIRQQQRAQPSSQQSSILGNIENQVRSYNNDHEQQNIQRLKQEIEQSKMLIQQYQQKSDVTLQRRNENTHNESIEERIRKVIAQSQALRENFA